jgi:DNA (cytosine-5)-methyltransferase 1
LVTRNAAHILKRYAFVQPGENWEAIPKRLMRTYSFNSECHTGVYHRLRANEPSIVIGNYRKNMLIHPQEDRGLSVREAARIQSFSDSYVFRGSIGFQQQQVGNAVPPFLAAAVFRSITHRS